MRTARSGPPSDAPRTKRCGVFGLLQVFADFLKYIVKEVVFPAGADKAVFLLAPMVTLVLA